MAKYFVQDYNGSYFQRFKNKKQLFNEGLEPGTIVYKTVSDSPEYTLAFDKLTATGTVLNSVVNVEYEDDNSLIVGVKRFTVEDAGKVKLVEFSKED